MRTALSLSHSLFLLLMFRQVYMQLYSIFLSMYIYHGKCWRFFILDVAANLPPYLSPSLPPSFSLSDTETLLSVTLTLFGLFVHSK